MSMTDYTQAIENLKRLIQQRKLLEAEWNKQKEKIWEPINDSFQDLTEKNLLDYYILENKIEAVRDLLTRGAHSKKAFFFAINSECDAIFSLLKYAQCDFDIFYFLFLKTELKKEIGRALVKAKLETLFGEIQPFKDKKTLWHYFAFLQPSDLTNAMLEEARKSNIDSKDDKDLTALGYAIFLKNKSMIDFFIKLGAKIDSLFHMSLYMGDFDLLKKLIEYGADLNKRDVAGHSSIISAVLGNNIDCVQYVLENQSSLQLTDFYHRNVLHYAVLNGNDAITDLLLKKISTSCLREKDYFGFTPVKNIENGNIILFDREEYTQCVENRRVVNQEVISERLNYFLLLYNHDPKFFKDGVCNALTFLFLLYIEMGKLDLFLNEIRSIVMWDGSFDALNAPYAQREAYAFLKDLFFQWSNDILWFQHSDFIDIFSAFVQDQQDRVNQYSFVKKHQLPSYWDTRFCFESKELSKPQLKELLDILSRIKSTKVEFYGEGHSTALYIDAAGKLNYFDPNQDFEMPAFSDTEALAQFLIDFKYVLLKKLQQNGNMVIGIKVYENSVPYPSYFDKMVCDDLLFQKHSPNGFTPLHIAILVNDFCAFQSILKNKLFDLNLTDNHGKTCLFYAVRNKRKDMITLLLATRRLHFFNENRNILFSLVNFEWFYSINREVQTITLNKIFYVGLMHFWHDLVLFALEKGVSANALIEVMERKKPSYVRMSFPSSTVTERMSSHLETLHNESQKEKRQQIALNSDKIYTISPLFFAIHQENAKMVLLLLEYGASLDAVTYTKLLSNKTILHKVLECSSEKLPIYFPEIERLFSIYPELDKVEELYLEHCLSKDNFFCNMFSRPKIIAGCKKYYGQHWLEHCIKRGADLESAMQYFLNVENDPSSEEFLTNRLSNLALKSAKEEKEELPRKRKLGNFSLK